MNVTASLAAKNNIWYAVINYPDPQTSKRKQKWVSTKIPVREGRTTHKKEAYPVMDSILADFKLKLELKDNDMLFSAWLLKYLDDTKNTRAESTNFSYRRTVTGSIAPWFDNRKLRLCDITTDHIQAFYNWKQSEDGGSVKAATIKKYHSIIDPALRKASSGKQRRIEFNPAEDVALPKDDSVFEGDFYTADELKTLLKNAKGSKIETPVYLASWFGLRRGEAIGLRWDAIDFDRKTLRVKGVMRDKGKGGTRNRDMYYAPIAKTKTSLRTLKMPEACIEYLKKLKADQERRKKKAGYNHEWDDFVCVRPNGDIIPLERVTRDFKNLCKRSGLKVIRLHDLRHTNCSLMIDNGASLVEAKDQLGHSNIHMTMKYSHVINATDYLSASLSETPSNEEK